MPRNLTSHTARLDPAARRAEQYQMLPLAEYLLPPVALSPHPRTDLDGLPSWERDEVLDREEATELAEDRFIGWQLGVLESSDSLGGPATDAEVTRWTARIEKSDRKAAKTRKEAEKAARKTAKAHEEPAPRALRLPLPPTTARENAR